MLKIQHAFWLCGLPLFAADPGTHTIPLDVAWGSPLFVQAPAYDLLMRDGDSCTVEAERSGTPVRATLTLRRRL